MPARFSATVLRASLAIVAAGTVDQPVAAVVI
jgi:hypothetical protein